jgi:hypothetical protein
MNGKSYKTKLLHDKACGATPFLKIFSGCHLFWRAAIVQAERFLLRAIIIELKWSLEADTLPQWSGSADPVLDGSKNFEMKAGCQKNCIDRAKMNRLHI